jgi:hypothetical protein
LTSAANFRSRNARSPTRRPPRHRAQRISQTNIVASYKLIAQGSVEEKKDLLHVQSLRLGNPL